LWLRRILKVLTLILEKAVCALFGKQKDEFKIC
jgi:hypothetical protein